MTTQATGDARLRQAAYQSHPGGVLDVNRSLYDAIAGAERNLVKTFVLPIRSGRAWTLDKGQLCRIVAVDGAQVGDLNLWNRHNPRERFWAARTRQLHRAHVSTYDRLWSTLPYLRPLCTIVADSLAGYGRDADGARVHDLLGTRCDPYVNQMLSGTAFDYHCHSNLTRAVLPYGLHEHDIHDVLNVFQATGLNDDDAYFMKTCPARKGDYFEFFAEQDLLVALSTCPGGDLSIPMWGEGSSNSTRTSDSDPTLQCCRPLGVEIYSVSADVLQAWTPPDPYGRLYTGQHGMQPREWADVGAAAPLSSSPPS